MTPFELAYDAWKTEGTRFWTVFSFMSATNGVLFAGVFFSEKQDARLALPAAIGVAFCCVWFGLQKRLAYWVSARQLKARELEPHFIAEATQAVPAKPKEAMANAEREKLSIFKELADAHDTRMKALDPNYPGVSARFGACLMPVMFLVGWILVAFGAENTMAFDLTNNWDETVKILLAVTGLACFFFGYQLLVAGLTAKTPPKSWGLPGCMFTMLGIVAWGLLLFNLWPKTSP